VAGGIYMSSNVSQPMDGADLFFLVVSTLVFLLILVGVVISFV
jgi:hypothetical protein